MGYRGYWDEVIRDMLESGWIPQVGLKYPLVMGSMAVASTMLLSMPVGMASSAVRIVWRCFSPLQLMLEVIY